MFKIENLSKIYSSPHGTVHALDNITLTIERGSFVSITGGSGSGKTTLLLALGGLNHPSRGSVIYDGKDIYSLPEPALAEYRNKRVGFVLQTFNLVPYLTALENVMLPMLFNSERNGNARQSAEGLLQKLSLEPRKEHLPRELSVGQQQRVAIARALANNPDVILADEPTGNLDPSLSEEILDILESLHREEKKTVVIVTHSPAAAKRAERIIRLNNGAIEI